MKRTKKFGVIIIVFFILIAAFSAYNKFAFKRASDRDLRKCINVYMQEFDSMNLEYNDITLKKLSDDETKELGYSCERYDIEISMNEFPKLTTMNYKYIFTKLPDELEKKYRNFLCYTNIIVNNDIYSGGIDCILKNNSVVLDWGEHYNDYSAEIEKDLAEKTNDNQSSDDYTADDLLDAQIKRLNGEKISKEDEIMLDGYDKWKADQDKYDDGD